MGKLTV